MSPCFSASWCSCPSIHLASLIAQDDKSGSMQDLSSVGTRGYYYLPCSLCVFSIPSHLVLFVLLVCICMHVCVFISLSHRSTYCALPFPLCCPVSSMLPFTLQPFQHRNRAWLDEGAFPVAHERRHRLPREPAEGISSDRCCMKLHEIVT